MRPDFLPRDHANATSDKGIVTTVGNVELASILACQIPPVVQPVGPFRHIGHSGLAFPRVQPNPGILNDVNLVAEVIPPEVKARLLAMVHIGLREFHQHPVLENCPAQRMAVQLCRRFNCQEAGEWPVS